MDTYNIEGNASGSQFLYQSSPENQGNPNEYSLSSIGEYPMQGIQFPGVNDVMLGRGGATNNHIGNIRFRQLVNEHKRRYLAASKVNKPKVAVEVVKLWRGLDPPGRFLTKTHTALGDGSPWHDVGDKKAREKASQCLRERTPDVIPFVRQLEQQEKEAKLRKEQEELNGTIPSVLDEQLIEQKVGRQTPNLASEPKQEIGLPTRLNEVAFKEDPRRRTNNNQEYAKTIPTGATLTKVAFSDDIDEAAVSGEEGRDFMEEYQQVLSDLAQSSSKDEEGPSGRPNLAKAQSGYSWIKSFKSIDSAFSAMDTSAYTMRDAVAKEQESDEVEGEEAVVPNEAAQVIPENTASQPEVVASAPSAGNEMGRKQRPRLVNAPYGRDSQMSLMSDLSSRSLMMGHAADQASKRSVLSVMSDMTELSDALKDMDLSAFGPVKPG